MPAPGLVFFFPGLFTGCSPLLVLSRSCFASLLVFFSAPTTLPRNPSFLSLRFIPLRSPFFFFLFPYPLHWYASVTDHFFFFWEGGVSCRVGSHSNRPRTYPVPYALRGARTLVQRPPCVLQPHFAGRDLNINWQIALNLSL